MGKFNTIQNSFTIGEVSDKFKGRTDAREYSQACDIVENFIVQKQGGVVKRPGSQFVADVSTATGGTNARAIPFIFSKNESYVCVFTTQTTPNNLIIYKSDGTQATVIDSALDPTQFADYDPNNLKYAQSGDVLALCYAHPEELKEDGTTVGVRIDKGIPPMLLIRLDQDNFRFTTLSHPVFTTPTFPTSFRFNAAIQRPYQAPNVDGQVRMHVDNVATGTGRVISAVDHTNTPIPFFTLGDVFDDNGTRATQIGSYFKIQKSGTEGVAYGTSINGDKSITQANINTGTDVVTSTGHSYNTRDIVTLTEGPFGGTDTVISGHPLVNSVYGDFFVRALTANTLSFYTTQADADADTNRIDFTTAGTKGLRIQSRKISSLGCTIEVAFEATLNTAAGASDDWRRSAWSSSQGFPRAVAFHEQRLFFGGTWREPQTVYGSQAQNIVNFDQARLEQDSSSPTSGSSSLSGLRFILFGDTKVTDPFSATIASKQGNQIQWMESQNSLLLGTSGAEYVLTGFDSIMSADNFNVQKQTEYGSNSTQPVSVGPSTLFITRDGRRVRDFKFNRTNGSYISNNLSVMNEEMVFKGFGGTSSDVFKNAEFTQLAHQPSRDVVWALNSKNELIGLTLSRESEITAWHYHPTRTTDSISSIAVTPSEDGVYDDLWITVNRDIDGNTDTYLEKISDDFDHDFLNNTSTDNFDVPYYSDSSIKVVLGSATATVTLPVNASAGSHLEGETVKVLVNGVVETDKTVSSNQITLDAVAPINSVVIVGLPYTSKLRTLDIDAGGEFGSSQGNRQRIDRLAARFYKSQKGKYGNSAQSTLFDIEYDNNEVFTGIKRLDFEITPNMDNQIVIEHADPTPFDLLSITYRGVSYD